MPAVVPRVSPDGPRLEVADEAVDYWASVGYVLADQPKKTARTTTKKAAARKTTAAKKSTK